MIVRPYNEYAEACKKTVPAFKDLKLAFEKLGRNKLIEPRSRFHK